jgi:hypothetical protein
VQNGKATRFLKIAWGALLVFINLLKLKAVSINNNKLFLALGAMAAGFGYNNKFSRSKTSRQGYRRGTLIDSNPTFSARLFLSLSMISTVNK